MSARRKRPVLYEVMRPDYRRSNPACPPAAPRPVRSEHESPVETPPQPRPAEEPRTPPSPRETRDVTISYPVITAAVAATIVLLFIAFVSGRRYEAGLANEPLVEYAMTEQTNTDAPPPAALIADVEPTPSRPVVEQTTDPETTSAVPQQPRTVVLEKGVHYVVVQHFRKSRRSDADAAAKFLIDHDIPCALHTGADIRLIATEPFLIDQADAHAGRREQTRANRLIHRIRELGEDFNKEMLRKGVGGYKFEGCTSWKSK